MKGPILIILAGLLIGAVLFGYLSTSHIPNSTTAPPGPKELFASYYRSVEVEVQPNVPPYPLPLDLNTVENLVHVASVISLSDAQRELLRRNGFVTIPYGRSEDIVAPYGRLKDQQVPIFVTIDTLLHLYHILFNETLVRIEEEEFFGLIERLSEAMVERSLEQYRALPGELKEAARRNVAFFAVGLGLLEPDVESPSPVRESVKEELGLIEAHGGFVPSPIFHYQEDYSQYVPRGHYTRSDRLKRYFKAMIWYGRMAFLLKGGPEALVSEEDARTQTLQASLIANSMDSLIRGSQTATDIWNRIYGVTAFFVGLADDLTPYEYREAILNLFGAGFQPQMLIEGGNLLRLKAELASLRLPRIYGGTGECEVTPPITPERLDQCLGQSQGMRFLGQRFVPDSYMFQKLVGLPYLGDGQPFTMCQTEVGPARCFPRGLDVMALLGSARAGEILEEEGDRDYRYYQERFSELEGEFSQLDVEDWNRNLYWSWLYSLKALLGAYPEGYPAFMQTEAFQDRSLSAALASWTELRHDTILYAKQSYTPALATAIPTEPVVGYVEPVPQFYARLLALTRMTAEGLTAMGVEVAGPGGVEGILERLVLISEAELRNEPLSEGDYRFIRNFGDYLEEAIENIVMEKEVGKETAVTEGQETTLVADVHTDVNTGQVLEEGLGYVDLVLAAYRVPDGRIIVGAGPTLSYYEFKHPMDDRLTDEAWRELLQTAPPGRPTWTNSFLAP